MLAEAGVQHSARRGEHLKNAFVYQRVLDRFTPVVQGMLNPLSVPAESGVRSIIDPIAFRPPTGSMSTSAEKSDHISWTDMVNALSYQQ
jgi:hypothetical protein